MNRTELWERYREHLCRCDSVGFSLDISRMNFGDTFLAAMAGAMKRAFDAMESLERGAVANPDEGRMVGHYWLRAPELAPSPAIRDAITTTLREVKAFAAEVHAGRIAPEGGDRLRNVLVIGIGGSALGPQFVSDALGSSGRDRMRVFFCDNTDPDGIDRTLAGVGEGLDRTLCVVISKSGETPETRNGMLEVIHAFAARDQCFGEHAVAVTQEGSELARVCEAQKWLRTFPMWDWVGGRTSELSVVGLLPAALQGLDIDGLLSGAREMDRLTRSRDVTANPAALMALMWHHASDGRGAKDMVVLPYKDRLALLSRYLQQLIMESLGKEKDLDGNVVHQGLTVYGNKGSTDQHAYVQQLRDGIHNFFVTFVEVLLDREGPSLGVEPDTTSGDYLLGFLTGTRAALYEKGRESMTITVDAVTARTVGAMIALFERAVGFYASLVNINAYHQPGVQAGKKAASHVLDLQRRLIRHMRQQEGHAHTAQDLAAAVEAPEEVETVYRILEHLSANPDRRITRSPGATPCDAVYSAMESALAG